MPHMVCEEVELWESYVWNAGYDSLYWYTRHVDRLSVGMARYVCGWVTGRKWYAMYVGMLTHGKWNVIYYAKQHQLD